jgi:hypothetical protein
MITPEQARAALEKVQAILRLVDGTDDFARRPGSRVGQIRTLAREAAALLEPVACEHEWVPYIEGYYCKNGCGGTKR